MPTTKHDGEDGKDTGLEKRPVNDQEAAFIVGTGGKTKLKLSTVSGAQIDLVGPKPNERSDKYGSTAGNYLEIRGTTEQRKRARKYIEFLIAQRQGPVKIDDPASHEDLTILVVPADTVSYVTGAKGQSLRLVEEEWGALLFFLQVDPKNPPHNVDPTRTERLAIFGPERSRRGAELKVMATIESKQKGHFTKNLTPVDSQEEGFATDTMLIHDDDYNYAIGRSGATRRKLARASNCIVEYVGKLAHFSGSKKERVRAKEYMQWLLLQRQQKHVKVDHEGRDDVTMVMVPSTCIGYVTGHKGHTLRSIEEDTNTFCFIEGSVDDGEDHKPLLIFGRIDDRRIAETLVWDRISQKSDELDVPGGQDGKKGKGKGKDKDAKGKGKDKDGKGKDGEKGYDKGGKKGREGKDDGKYSERYQRPSPVPPKDLPGPDADKKPEWREGDDNTVFLHITDKDAAFLMGPAGKTKRKIAAVSGAALDLNANILAIKGSAEERHKAKKYVQLVMAQRVGPVHLNEDDDNDDLSIMEVPADSVSFVTGKSGSFLRLVEEEFGTLLFFIDFDKTHRRDSLERLAIFGCLRERRGAELKVMAAIEMKQPGYFTKRDEHLPLVDPSETFGTDRMVIEDADYSYALGKGGATRKKIARASGCIIEYVGRLAYMTGTKQERTRAREYLTWLFQQRVGSVEVDYENRDDVTVLQVPKDCVGFVTGHKGTSLRMVEDATGAFCFIEGGRDDPHRDPKPLLIFGNEESRKQAEDKLRMKIDQKMVEGWVHEEGDGGGYHYDGGDKGGGRSRDRRAPRGGGGGGRGGGSPNFGGAGSGRGSYTTAGPSSGAGSSLAPPAAPTAEEEEKPAGEQDDDEAWGDWGGSSEDESKDVAPNGNGGGGGASWQASSWSGGGDSGPKRPVPPRQPSSPYHPHQGYSHAAGGGAAPSGPMPRSGEDVELPPQLLHEEAWPELGDLGAPKRGKKR